MTKGQDEVVVKNADVHNVKQGGLISKALNRQANKENAWSPEEQRAFQAQAGFCLLPAAKPFVCSILMMNDDDFRRILSAYSQDMLQCMHAFAMLQLAFPKRLAGIGRYLAEYS